jgi:formylmethanofuran dehydrogenase subunit E
VDSPEEFESDTVECSECGEEFDELALEYVDPPTCKACARELEGEDGEGEDL